MIKMFLFLMLWVSLAVPAVADEMGIFSATALWLNAIRGRYEVVALLLEYGAAEMENQSADYHRAFNQKVYGLFDRDKEQMETNPGSAAPLSASGPGCS